MGNVASSSQQPAASVPDAEQLHKVLLAMKHTSYELLAKSEVSKDEEDAEVGGGWWAAQLFQRRSVQLFGAISTDSVH